jgi:hypothetical protein
MKFHTCSQREPLDNFLGEREKGSRRRWEFQFPKQRQGCEGANHSLKSIIISKSLEW